MDSSAPAFKLLFVGDVVGRPGRQAVAVLLPALRQELEPDLIVVNGENSAGGTGITGATATELLDAGADLITTGNHVWDQKQFLDEIGSLDRVLRPQNFPPGTPGVGSLLIEAGGTPVLVMNLQGRVFLQDLDDPFRAADEVLATHAGRARIVICDIHAEATSEKVAMGWHLDGRASAVLGTHTHVPTADSRLLPGGTAYVTDVGMVGPRDGVIGMDAGIVLQRFRSAIPYRFAVAKGIVTFNSVLVTISTSTGRATAIQRIDREHN